MKFGAFLILIFILFCLSMAAVSAADAGNETIDDTLALDDSKDCDVILENDDTQQDVLTEGNEIGKFSELQNIINDAGSYATIYLDKDYESEGKQITINKDITIDGKGHTLDCLGKSRAFASTKGDIVLRNIRFTNGYEDDGGVINFQGDTTCRFHNCIFYSNYGEGFGGAVFLSLADEGTTLFINCQFKGNIADDYGGGVASKHGKLYFSCCNFTANCADCYGGAINGWSDVSVQDCYFESNKADGSTFDSNGGAIYAEGNIYISDSTFMRNICHDYGGAAYSRNDIYVNLNHDSGPFTCFFIRNEAQDEQGGALFAGNNIKMTNAQFDGNLAFCDGGATYSCENTYVTHCIFESNRAEGASTQCQGGGIYCRNALTVDNCSFINNFAFDYGGAIYADMIAVKPTYSYFRGNFAEDDQGGAIWTNKFTEDLSHATFIDNFAGEDDDGGAIYIDNKNTLTISYCTFIHNVCGDEGGAIYLDAYNSHLSLIENYFSENKADDGSAVYNCGKYDEIRHNSWAIVAPTKDNDMIVEWHPWPRSDECHVDSQPVIRFDTTYWMPT